MIRIVVINGNDKSGTYFRNSLGKQDDFDVVGSGKDEYEALKLIGAHRPDIVLMDIDPNWDMGIQTVSLIKSRHNSTAIIIHSAFLDDSRVFKTFLCGCSAYLSKNISPELLCHSIRAVFWGGCLVSSEIMASLHNMAGIHGYLSPGPEKPVLPETLSNTELRIMGFIGQGLNNREIAARLQLETGTVRNYTSSLMQKINLADRTQVAVYATKAGVLACVLPEYQMRDVLVDEQQNAQKSGINSKTGK
jgi:DNA-binding NarL/FixJ family response regulator